MSRRYRAAQLNVQQLLTFRKVFEMGGYASAASESDLSVASVWQHIRAVERAYGVRLFRKVGRRVEATEEAAKLHNALDEILVNLESTFDSIGSESAENAPIRIVTGNRMMLEDLAEPFAAFQKKFSNRLLIRSGDNRRTEDLLMSEQADLGLSLEPAPERQSAKIHYESGYFVDFLAVAPKRHPFAKSKTSGLREIVKHPLVVTQPGTHGREALEQALYRERLEAEIAVETDNSAITIACVQAGMGLGIVAGRPDGQLSRKLVCLSLRRQLGRRQIVLMWRKGRILTEPMLTLVETVKSFRAK